MVPLALVLVSAALPDSTHAAARVASESQRTVLSFNGPWTVSAPAHSTEEFPIEVPGNFPITGGVVTWKRTFTLDLPEIPQVAFLTFDAVTTRGEVRLNGIEVGTLEAFTRARLDVLAALVLVGQNTLEVDLDDRSSSDSVPGGAVEPLVSELGTLAYTLIAPWQPMQGIIREVSLTYSAHPLISDVFATPLLDDDLVRADLQVRVRILQELSPSSQIRVALYDTGEPISVGMAQPSGLSEFEVVLPVDAPRLWSPQAPNLYDLFVTITDGETVDAVVDRVGFRKLELIGNRLYLNGDPLFLRGVTRHDLYGASGFVVDEQILLEDVQRLKSIGVNYVRAIHYPPDERVVHLADEIGLLVSEEIPAWALLGRPDVAARAATMLGPMVERDFNHPSVIFWLAGTWSDIPGVAAYLELAASVVKAIDSHRPVSFVFDDSPETQENFLANLALARSAGMDFLAQNGYWDAATIASIAAVLPEDFPVVIAEWTGSEGSNRGPVGEPGFTSFPGVEDPLGIGVMTEAFQASQLLESLFPWLPLLLIDEPAVTGMVYYNWQDVDWTGATYLFPGHLPALRNGLVYEDRHPKLAFTVFELVMNILKQVDMPP